MWESTATSDFTVSILTAYVGGLRGGGSWIMYLSGIILYTLLRCRYQPSVRVAMASVVFSLSTLMTEFGTLFGNMIEFQVQGFDIAITKVISCLLIVAVAVLFYRYPIFRFKTEWYDSVLNIVCNLLSAAVFLGYEIWRATDMNVAASIRIFVGFITAVGVVLFVINIATYFMTYFLYRERERVLLYRLEEQKRQKLDELLSLSEQKLAELREMRHDVKNQYAYMQSMLEEERYDDLKAYFNELIGTFAKPLYECVDSGNAVVDSIFNLELSKAREAGVRIDTRIAVPPELPFPQSGLLALFTNVIDNAIEAVVREKRTDGFVRATLGVQGDYLFFCVINPTDRQDDDGSDVSTDKPDKELHGYGMRIIRKTVKKYNGYYRHYIKDGQFVAETLLDLYYDPKSRPAAKRVRGGTT